MNPANPTTTANPTGTALAYQRGPHWVALAAAVFTFPLLLVGGTVTTYKVGMAVPDWPTTFGINMFLYDFWNAAWGVFIEHTHRLYGAAVGVAMIVLAFWFQFSGARPAMKKLGWFALAAVIGQGILGGLRVRWISTDLAAVHGCTGQAFFGLLVAIVTLTGRRWIEAGPPRADVHNYRSLSAGMLGLIYAQIVAGAYLRHYGLGLIVHASLATVVLISALALVGSIHRRKASVPELMGASNVMGFAVLAQVLLGVGAWWILPSADDAPAAITTYQAMIRTFHQSNAALLLSSGIVLMLRAWRHLGTTNHDTVTPPALADGEAAPPVGAALEEVLA